MAKQVGLIGALIRKIVIVAPAGAMTAILVTLGVLSSIVSDGEGLVLIPLGALAFHIGVAFHILGFRLGLVRNDSSFA